MTVIFKPEVDNAIRPSELIYVDRKAVKAIVRAALISTTEAHVDFLIDFPDSYKTRDDIQGTLTSVKAQTADFLKDVLDDLRKSVLFELENAQYGGAVTSMKFDLAGGLSDVEIDMTVNWD